MHRQEFFIPSFTCKFGGDLSGRTVDRKKPKTGKTYIRENAGQFASRQEKKEFKQKGEKRRRNLMVSALLILLAVLGVFKYADFVIDNMNAVFMRLEVIGSWNIWIYCFQWEFPFIHFSRWDICWMYIGKNRCTEEFFKHLLFVSFFHNWYRDRSAVIPIYHRRCMKNMYLTKAGDIWTGKNSLGIFQETCSGRYNPYSNHCRDWR